MNVETENIVPNGSAVVTDGVGLLASPTHSSGKYISPHIGNISKGDSKLCVCVFFLHFSLKYFVLLKINVF